MFCMSSDLEDKDRRAILAYMAERGLKIYPWSQRAGRDFGTLSKFLKGKTHSMKRDTLVDYARAENTTVERILGERQAQKIREIGFIKNGEVIFLPENKVELVEITRTDLPERKSSRIRIEDNSIGFPVGTFLYILDEGKKIDDLIGKYCIVTTHDGKTLIKNIERGSKRDNYMLWSLGATPINETKLKWAAKIHSFELPK